MTSRAATPVAFVGFKERTLRVRPGARPATSALASTRLRVLLPAIELAKRFPVYLVSFDDFLADPRLSALGADAAIVFRKLSTTEVVAWAHTLHYVVEQLQALAGERRVLADLSDDYSAASSEAVEARELADYQAALLAACPITVPCEALAARLRPRARLGVRVVEDAFEGPPGAPRAPASPLRVCWFGHGRPAQLDALERALAGIAERVGVFEAVTASGASGFFSGLAARLPGASAGFRVRFTPWSPAATWQALRDCDAVLLPQDASEWGVVKSHNRLVETIRAGRIGIASPIPSYQELADYAWVGADFAAGAAWAIDHADLALERIRAGQDYIGRRFSPAAVARKWTAALGLDDQAG